MTYEPLNGEIQREARRHGIAHRIIDLDEHRIHEERPRPDTFEELLEVVTE